MRPLNKILKLWQSEGIKTIDGYNDHKLEIQSKVQKQLKNKLNKTLLAIYDTADCPLTMDITTFLLNADNTRALNSIETMDIVIVCHHEDPAPTRQKRFNSNNYRHILYNFFIENTRLFTSIGSLIIFDNRKKFDDYFEKLTTSYKIFPEDYNPNCPVEHSYGSPPSFYPSNLVKYENLSLSLQPPKEYVQIARNYIINYVYPKIPITITLREWEKSNGKNSNIREWQKLIDYYSRKRKDIQFILMRDFYKLYSEPVLHGTNVIECNEAVLQLSLRAALYQEASLNLLVNNGCAMQATCNEKVNYLIFQFISTGKTNASEKLVAFTVGLQNRDQFHGSNEYQKIIYEADKFETMKFHVDRMLSLLEYNNKIYPKFYDL